MKSLEDNKRGGSGPVCKEVYGKAQHELDLLRLLARGEKEIEAGVGHDLDEVLKEADRFLAR